LFFTQNNKDLIDKLSDIDNLSDHLKELSVESRNLLIEANRKHTELKDIEHHINKIIQETTAGCPWISDVIAQYFETRDLKVAEYLEMKKHPAFTSAKVVKEIAKEKRLFKKEALVAKNFVKYYEFLFPDLKEYIDYNLDDLISEIYEDKEDSQEKDPVRNYFISGEYEKLSVTERNQKALDKYWNRDKKPWQIGRDYERYIGYLYEETGWKVSYFGAIKRLEDLGIDLICTKQNKIEIVQCKYWSKKKGYPIRESHISQLFGTTVRYYLKHCCEKDNKIQFELYPELLNKGNIKAVMFTSTELSETAKEFAKILGVKVKNYYMNYSYPSIKCNVSRDGGTKIYHLPFDQQYDKILIEPEKGELYVRTVKEAENLGFRRAWRWQGNEI